ncbi:hypothetical protein [Haloarchaeobius sp. DT45]|uniref:hypothetical protein n=1 Tax=Haloarchaeobius sp. DT45 TaxID=3446116 RepID=UPI003F6CEE9D
MCICNWLSENLATIGLIFDLIGATLMVGTKFNPGRAIGFWLFPKHSKRASGYQTLLENGEILPTEEGFTELRNALFPTGKERVFSSQSKVDAEELFSDKDAKPVRIKKEDFKVERLDPGYPPKRADRLNNIVNSKEITTISELHYIADKRPNTPNVNEKRKLTRSYDDIDDKLEEIFEGDMLNFGLQVLIFGFLLQLIASLGVI